MSDSSLKNYENNKKEFETDRKKVLHLVDTKGPIAKSDVARIMGKPIHAISGRFTELQDANEIKVVDQTKNRFGNFQDVVDTVKDEQVF